VPFGRHPTGDGGSFYEGGFELRAAPSLDAEEARDSCPADDDEQFETANEADMAREAGEVEAGEAARGAWAALVFRGGCSFRAKALRQQRAGAAAVLLVDRPLPAQGPTVHTAQGKPASGLAAWLAATTDAAALDAPQRAAWAALPSMPSLGELPRSLGPSTGSPSSSGRVRVPVVMATHAVGAALVELLRSGVPVQVHVEVHRGALSPACFIV
jgi:hypothetical protein